MRNEKYYGVFDYGDELTPGSELKIEHTVVQDYYSNQIDLVPFIDLGVEPLSKARDQSVEAEKVIFSKIKDSICEWERQAAITKTYDRALEYLNTHAVAHTSNQWIHENYHDRDMISNMVYEMTVSVWEETKYDRAKQECRRRGIKKLKVVYSKEKPIRPMEDMSISCRRHCVCPPGTRKCTVRRDIPGSTAFVPSVAGLIIAGEVIKELTSFER